jgi:hypothetical protein
VQWANYITQGIYPAVGQPATCMRTLVCKRKKGTVVFRDTNRLFVRFNFHNAIALKGQRRFRLGNFYPFNLFAQLVKDNGQ